VTPMSPSARSSRIYGRDAELEDALGTVQSVASGAPGVLLVAGDAGIGKTRLVRMIAHDAASRGFTVLEGHCLDVEAAIPFAPVVEALRALVTTAGDDPERPAARRLGALLDQATPNEPANALDELRQVLAEATAAGPVMLVLEDMHWADQSTRDFALTVARTAKGRLLLVLTFRSDDLTRRHPFRKALAELSRSSTRIDLPPLERAAIRDLVTDCTGGTADPSLVGSLLARSEGNPLYAEELLAGDPSSLSGSLTDLLLTRVDALSSSTRDLLRVASVNGTRIDSGLLVRVVDVDEDTVEAGLREATEANVVVSSGDDLAFRHGLLREAVYDDLLPGERSRVHSRCAAVLQEDLDRGTIRSGLGALGQLAYHCYAAHDLPAALAASVRAGLAAKTYGAPEAGAHLERAIELWDQVPDPEARSGHAKADLVRLLAEVADMQGDKDRQHALVQQAVALLEPDGDPLLASRVYAALGTVCLALGDPEAHAAAVEKAVELAGDQPSAELGAALRVKADDHVRHCRYRDGLALARRAVEVARLARCPAEEVEALAMVYVCELYLGRTGAAREALERAIDAAESNGQPGEALFQTGELAWSHILTGDVDTGLAMASAAYERAVAAALPSAAVFCREQLVEATRWRGELDDADLLLSDLLDVGMPVHRWRWHRAWNLMARGQMEAALDVERDTIALFADIVGVGREDAYEREVALFVALGDVPEAVRIAHDFLTGIADGDSAPEQAWGAVMGFQALAAATDSGTPVPDDLESRAARALARATDGLTGEWETGIEAGLVMVAAALADRLSDRSSVAHWRAALAIDQAFGDYYALRARIGLAEALLTEGERDEGRELLVDVWTTARRIGAGYFVGRARRLATRTRLPLPDDETVGPLTRLTAREREVLDLLATGATNKGIAGSLVISEKTASVHVSNILAKLGCGNRGEAAAMARELVSG
jgi:DNA-binding CsgD family transcriptional regulator/tetratricopeptide (TPR) repeat protein